MATLSQHNQKLQSEGKTSSVRRGDNLSVGAGITSPSSVPTKYYEEPKSNVQKFGEWTKNVGTSLVNLGADAAVKGANFVKNTGVDIYQDAFLAGRSLTTDYFGKIYKNVQIADNMKELDQKSSDIVAKYKAGQMSKEDYIKANRELSAAYGDLGKQSEDVSAGPSPAERAEAIASTGVNILSLGRLSLAKQGLKTGVEQAAQKTFTSFIDDAGRTIEQQFMKNGAFRSLIQRNLMNEAKIAGSKTTSEFIARNSKQIASDLLIKRPLFYQQNVQDAKNLLVGVIEKNPSQALSSAAWIGLQMLDGGPLGAFFKHGSKLKVKLGQLAYGRDSFIDTVSRNIGNGNANQIARFLEKLQEKAPDAYKKAVQTFRIAQEMNLRTASDDVGIASRNFLQTYEDSGIDLRNVTPSQLFKDMNNWVDADNAWQNAVKKGLIPDMDMIEASRFTPVRWDNTVRDSVAETVKNAESPQQALDAIRKMADKPGNGWGNNENLYKQLENIVTNAKSSDEAAKGIKAINAAQNIPKYIPKEVRSQLAKLGYTIAEPVGGRRVPHLDPDSTRKLVTNAVEGSDDNFEESIIPNEGLNIFANMLEDFGMSPRTSNQAANRVLSENMVANLDNSVAATVGLSKKGDIPRGGQAILNELQMFVENRKAAFGLPGKAAISDLRQLTYKEIQEALPSLKLTRNDAKQLHRGITQAYLDVPLQLRGAGDKIVDALYRYNPLHKTYSRIQSAFRYTYNPFFRVQERTETALLSRASANNLIWNQPRPVLDDAVRKLDEARIFTSSLYGEAAQDQVLGRITANITQGQKRDLAGLALDIAKKKGTTIDDMIINHADELDDALRVIVQYPKKGFLASPLARTLNLAFFPMRYNLKVTKLAAESLAKQPPYIQKAVLHSLFTMGDWLKSDEGIRWQQQHQDAIRLFNWITPVNSIAYTMNLLTNKPDELSDLGMLGGLPMGVITQILDSQGIISINNPYVDKKTGDTFPKYIPQTTKARASVAITDLLGSMFTYPGRTLGLPGKGETMRAAVKQFIATNGKDFEKRLDESQLTELDKKWIQVLKGDMSDEAIDALYNSPALGQYNGYTLPPLTLPFKLDTPKQRTGLPTKADLKAAKGSTKKTKKIAQPIQ